MKKAPSYTDILKAIAKAKTIRQLDRVNSQAVNYAGAPYKITTLYNRYRIKREKLYSKTK